MLAAGTSWALAAVLAGSAAADVVAIEVDAIVAADGSIGAGGYLVIRDGQLIEVGAQAAPAGAWVVRHPGCTACPGFVDPVTALGAAGELDEIAAPFTPELRAGDALEPGHTDYARAARGGVTAVGLAPGDLNIIAGTITVLGTGDKATALAEGPLKLSLSSSSRLSNRKPTSRMGALAMLRPLVSEGLPGNGALFVDARTPDEVRITLELLGATGRPLVVTRSDGFLGNGGEHVAAEFGRSGGSVLVGPYSLTSSQRELQLPAQLAGAGVRVAFRAGGNAGRLRMSASLAVKEGLDPARALAGVTSVPASLLGAGDRIGSLAAGRRADVLVYRGHPLDLSASLEAVYVGGQAMDLRQ